MTATKELTLPDAFGDLDPSESVMEIQYYGFTAHVVWCLMTVDRAASLLEINTRNRKPKSKQIDRYANDMAHQNWIWNGSTVCISAGPDPVLLDGQNRLMAVVKSGQPVWTLVVTGLPISAQDEMDNGASRSFGDTLAIAGESNANALAALVRFDLKWQQGLHSPGSQTVNHSRSQLQKHLDLHPEIRDVLYISQNARKKLDINATVANQCALLFHRIDPEDCREFWLRLATIGGDHDDPIVVLQNTLVNAQAERRRGRPMDNWLKMALIIKAWNAYRTGHKVKLLKFKAGGANPDNFPTPV